MQGKKEIRERKNNGGSNDRLWARDVKAGFALVFNDMPVRHNSCLGDLLHNDISQTFIQFFINLKSL